VNAPAAGSSPPLGALIARLSALHPQRIDLSLERMHRLLERLDHPERKLPPVIHVAGTNGKGSVVAFLRAMLEAAGKRVHVYTSPHLVRYNERYRLGDTGELVSDEGLAPRVEALGMGVGVTDTIMANDLRAEALARYALSLL